jgi:F0F1-type ATP synthase delta subunit
MNGKTFQGFNHLKEVLLEDNECINKKFRSQSAIATIQRAINEHCSFNEVLQQCMENNEYKMKEIEELQEQLEDMTKEVIELRASNARLNKKIDDLANMPQF